jgi:hypothetical protein
MTKEKKKIAKKSKDNTTNANNINRGNPIYYNNKIHYIVYEFEDKIIISKTEDLSKAFCVNKSRVSIKPIK